ncbi:MAG: tetratricopeptide repeat protein [Theionarchaea archaeon]|nr:tetratricopeptide repeat protein [Theionarchaea archaeon]
MTPTSSGAVREAELMFEILNFARCHGRKILEDQIEDFEGEKAQIILHKLLIGEYLGKVEKKDVSDFYTLTSKGLNLFKRRRKSQPVSKELRTEIIEKLKDAMAELEIKPWEVMFHIIHVIEKRKVVTAGDIGDYFTTYFPDIKGTSRASVYRNIKHLRMKGYIEYEKRSHIDQNQYRLSKKGEGILHMTKIDATQKLRTLKEWDDTLKKVFERVADERKEDEQALFCTMERSVPGGLDKFQIVWVLHIQGNLYELKGNLDKAEEMYVRMEAFCEELDDPRGRAYALKGLGNVSFKKEKYAVAEQYYKKCCTIAQTLEDNLLLSDGLNNLGSCLYMNDDIDEALSRFENALTLQGIDTFRKASTLYNEGLCYARKEDLGKAKILWEESLALYRELQETAEIKKVDYNLRQIDRKQKQEYLEETYRKALHTGTSQDIKKAYKELAEFQTDALIAPIEE